MKEVFKAVEAPFHLLCRRFNLLQNDLIDEVVDPEILLGRAIEI